MEEIREYIREVRGIPLPPSRSSARTHAFVSRRKDSRRPPLWFAECDQQSRRRLAQSFHLCPHLGIPLPGLADWDEDRARYRITSFPAKRSALILPFTRLPVQFDTWVWKVPVGHVTETKIGLLVSRMEQDQLRFSLLRRCNLIRQSTLAEHANRLCPGS